MDIIRLLQVFLQTSDAVLFLILKPLPIVYGLIKLPEYRLYLLVWFRA